MKKISSCIAYYTIYIAYINFISKLSFQTVMQILVSQLYLLLIVMPTSVLHYLDRDSLEEHRLSLRLTMM